MKPAQALNECPGALLGRDIRAAGLDGETENLSVVK